VTDAEKIARYDRIAEIVNDQMALESHRRAGKAKEEAIELIRAEAYEDIVDVVVELNGLLMLEATPKRRGKPVGIVRRSAPKKAGKGQARS